MVKKKTKTGFCSLGHHEGTQPHSPSGKPLKTCEFWQDCGCDCHVEITAMFEATGNERVTVYNPEWSAPKSEYWVPSIYTGPAPLQDQTPAKSCPGLSDIPDISDMPNLSTSEPEFQPTPSGRKARGQLENQVLEVCERWLAPDNDLDWDLCTPKLIAQEINPDRPPSTGAINAVFARWGKLGFAEIGKKPIAFIAIKNGSELARLKARVRQEQQREKSRQKRGVRA